MGADIQGQYPRDVLPDKGGGTAHEARHAIINTASINADAPNPTLLGYAMTKGAIQNFTAGLAQLLAEKGIRANAVASGPIWTPLIPSTTSEEAIENFGKQVLRMKRPGQPAEPSPVWQCRHETIGTFPDVGNKRPHLLVFARSH